jgi:hypothetical protein
MPDDSGLEAEGRRIGRELWPAGASWVPDEVLAAFEALAAGNPSLNTDAARATFLNAARNARKSAPTTAEARGRAELLERLRRANAERAASNDAERDPERAAMLRRRRASLERRRAARHEND